MVVNEQRRRLLHGLVADAMGVEAADVLLDELPPLAWSDVATKLDLEHLATELRGEIAGVRGEIAGLRGEIAGLRGVIEGVQAGLHGEIEGLRGEMVSGFGKQTRAMVFSTMAMWIATMGTVGAMFVALAH